ncbi:transposase [Thermosynechococcaceae cyanobacterium BACA0444]|uniref:Transposase n=1 Tax=Pseudocalidococcus azoricus BACA0444 TaxID=2918990 RepID=A0AAE4FRJ0_9CYAN|nr:transposase [Pseudocalidococcus azoricus BACA0444]
MGTRDLNFYQLEQINRVRVVRRSDGYYAQFLVNVKRVIDREPTKKTVGIDVGLAYFYTDSDGNTVENPRYLRKSEKRLKRAQRRVSKKVKGSKNRRKAIAPLHPPLVMYGTPSTIFIRSVCKRLVMRCYYNALFQQLGELYQ